MWRYLWIFTPSTSKLAFPGTLSTVGESRELFYDITSRRERSESMVLSKQCRWRIPNDISIRLDVNGFGRITVQSTIRLFLRHPSTVDQQTDLNRYFKNYQSPRHLWMAPGTSPYWLLACHHDSLCHLFKMLSTDIDEEIKLWITSDTRWTWRWQKW